MHTEEPQIPTSLVPDLATIAPLPAAPISSVPQESSTPSTTTHADSARPSSSAPPPQHITNYARDFLAIMDAIRTFSITSGSFAAVQAALVEWMIHTEAALEQNQTILVQIQSHLGLPPTSLSVPAQASSVHPPSASPAQLALTDLLNMLVAVTIAATPPVTPAEPQLT